MNIAFKLIMWFLLAIFWWKVFEKANIKGWKALIPFYCDYMKFKMADKKWLYFPFLLLGIIESVVGFIYDTLKVIELADAISNQVNIESDLSTLFWTHTVLVVLVFAINVLIGIKIANKFKKGAMFGIGLGIIPIIFVPILAFDNSIYTKKGYC